MLFYLFQVLSIRRTYSSSTSHQLAALRTWLKAKFTSTRNGWKQSIETLILLLQLTSYRPPTYGYWERSYFRVEVEAGRHCTWLPIWGTVWVAPDAPITYWHLVSHWKMRMALEFRWIYKSSLKFCLGPISSCSPTTPRKSRWITLILILTLQSWVTPSLIRKVVKKRNSARLIGPASTSGSRAGTGSTSIANRSTISTTTRWESRMSCTKTMRMEVVTSWIPCHLKMGM